MALDRLASWAHAPLQHSLPRKVEPNEAIGPVGCRGPPRPSGGDVCRLPWRQLSLFLENKEQEQVVRREEGPRQGQYEEGRDARRRLRPIGREAARQVPK